MQGRLGKKTRNVQQKVRDLAVSKGKQVTACCVLNLVVGRGLCCGQVWCHDESGFRAVRNGTQSHWGVVW